MALPIVGPAVSVALASACGDCAYSPRFQPNATELRVPNARRWRLGTRSRPVAIITVDRRLREGPVRRRDVSTHNEISFLKTHSYTTS